MSSISCELRKHLGQLVLAAVVSAGVGGCGGSPEAVKEPETTTPLPDDSMLRPIDSAPTAPAKRNIQQR